MKKCVLFLVWGSLVMLAACIPQPALEEVAKRQLQQEMQTERSLKEGASVGAFEYRLTDLTEEDIFPQYDKEYETLTLTIPVTFVDKGTYKVDVQYDSVYNSGRRLLWSTEDEFAGGSHSVVVVFDQNSFQRPSYWLDGSASTITVKISKWTSEAELFGGFGRNTQEQYWEVTKSVQDLPVGYLPTVSQ